MSVELKVNGNEVKVLSNGYVYHKFECKDLSVQGLLSQLKKEKEMYDLEEMEVLDVK